jgi:tryptophan 2,3-dioxygenase
MLFIIIHQAYELWFKQVLIELDSILDIMSRPELDDNSGQLQTIVHRLQRVATILGVLVQQIDILETMTPMDFLDFRDMLRPASGFQSWQFKLIEARLGLKFSHRHGQAYYISQLKPEDVERIKQAEEKKSVLELLNSWLERFPFFDQAEIWTKDFPQGDDPNIHGFWKAYLETYANSLAEGERNNLDAFKQVFFSTENDAERSLSPKASRAALFIMTYRGYPMLELPFQLLDTLLEIDNQLGNWRYRHINMVRRMIGSRIGTGGSPGAGSLQGAMDKHYIFREIAQLNSFLVDRRRLPALPALLAQKMGYHL